MAAQIVTLGEQKYQLIPVAKGTKVPSGVQAIKWHDGNDYILSPVTPTPAKAAEVVKGPETKVETVKTAEKSPVTKTATPWWVWVLIALGVILIGIFLFKNMSLASAQMPQATEQASESGGGVIPADTAASCQEAASKIGAPIGSSICNKPLSGAPAARAQAGSEIAFGTITFDSETRVWILQNFVVPTSSNYSFDYTGREQNVLTAPFVVGAEKNPVNGENFSICWNTEGDCTPPVAIEFFQ